MSLVFFDFDGTLTTRDTVWPLGVFLARSRRLAYPRIAAVLLWMVFLKLRVLSNHEFKQKFCRLLLKGESARGLEKRLQIFANGYLEGLLNRGVVDTLRRHQLNGDDVYLVSSNFSFLLLSLSERWNIGVIATNLEVKEGVFTGRIDGVTCDGKEKLARVLELFDVDAVRAATAYGDSRGDRELLAFVKTPVWI
jgi:HAD superfamily hydrolase (TIGR01490 family)